MVNAKCISSSAVKKSVFSRLRSTSENANIFTARDELYLVFTKRSKELRALKANLAAPKRTTNKNLFLPISSF